MALNRYEVFGFIVIMIMVVLIGNTRATECRNAIVSLSPCITYVCGNSSTPSSSCCSQLAGVVKSKPWCLCALVSGGHSSMGFKINETLALGLPAACSVHTPPVSNCNGNGTQTGNGTLPENGTPPIPAKSDANTIYLPFYSCFIFLLAILKMHV